MNNNEVNDINIEKIRLDLLIAKNKSYSREYIKQIIKEGKVLVNNKVCMKSGQKFYDNCDIIINAEQSRYVGRGGYKLEKALDYFNINLNDKVCLDVGASTGGFSDCMIQNNAQLVYAIDSGQNQLHENLKRENRILSFEKMKIQDFTVDVLFDFICVDVSFVSVTKVFESVNKLAKDCADIIILIKPQFEAGSENLSKKGIVKNPKVHMKVLNSVSSNILDYKVSIIGLTHSPIKGQGGNIEYLMYLKKSDKSSYNNLKKIIEDIVKTAFIEMDKPD